MSNKRKTKREKHLPISVNFDEHHTYIHNWTTFMRRHKQKRWRGLKLLSWGVKKDLGPLRIRRTGMCCIYVSYGQTFWNHFYRQSTVTNLFTRKCICKKGVGKFLVPFYMNSRTHVNSENTFLKWLAKIVDSTSILCLRATFVRFFSPFPGFFITQASIAFYNSFGKTSFEKW